MVSLTWNRRNPFADGLGETSDGGLSALGRELVHRLSALGVILDLSHASERTFAQVIETAPEATVVASHANCRALVDTPRNLSDEQLARSLLETASWVCCTPLRLTEPTIERLVDHVDHIASVVGIEHAGLGSDFTAQIIHSGAVTRAPLALLPTGMPLDASIQGLAGPETTPRWSPHCEPGLRRRQARCRPRRKLAARIAKGTARVKVAIGGVIGLTCALEWAGLRTLPDGLPLIGPVPGRAGLFVATGRGMMGVTLAPS